MYESEHTRMIQERVYPHQVKYCRGPNDVERESQTSCGASCKANYVSFLRSNPVGNENVEEKNQRRLWGACPTTSHNGTVNIHVALVRLSSAQ